MGTLAQKRRRPKYQTHGNMGGSAVREMGQSAWLNTSFLTIQGSEGRVNARETGKGCKDWILWGNIYSVWPVIGKGETYLVGKSRSLALFRSML